jgi:chemotaxis protein MotB
MKYSIYIPFISIALFLTGCSNIQTEYEKQKITLGDQEKVIGKLKDRNTYLESKIADLELKLGTGEITDKHNARLNELDSQMEQKMKNMMDSLDNINLSLPDNETIKVTTTADGKGISLPGSILFKSGSASLRDNGRSVINKIVKEILEKYPSKNFRVEGHTDDQPIKRSADKFKDNWDLGAARSMSVLNAILKKTSINARQFYISSHGQYSPVSSKKSANRRVQIIILNN